MKALILAAGYGTRLYPLTINQPKPLLLVGKQPIINFVLKKVAEIKGVDEVFVVTNDKFFASFRTWALRAKASFRHLRIIVVNDGSKSPKDRLGAIGDIHFVIGKRKVKKDLLVVGGDNLFNFGLKDFIKFARRHSPAVSLGLVDIRNKREASKFGVVDLDRNRRLKSFLEKPKLPPSTLIAMCLYFLPREGLRRIGEYLIRQHKSDTSGDYIKWLHKRQPVYGYVFKGDWFDIGHLDSYSKANREFEKKAKEDK